MTPVKGLENKPLISITDGKKIGQIKDIYIDSEGLRMVAVLLGHEGLINRKAIFVERAAISVLGVDAWLVTGPAVATELAQGDGASSWLVAGDMRGREVTTDGGTKIGTLDDVLFDDKMNVTGFALGKLYVKGPLADRKRIARSAVISLGAKSEPMIIDLSKAEAVAPEG